MKPDSAFPSEVFFLAQGLDSAAQLGIIAYVVVSSYGKQSDRLVDMAIDRQVEATWKATVVSVRDCFADKRQGRSVFVREPALSYHYGSLESSPNSDKNHFGSHYIVVDFDCL